MKKVYVLFMASAFVFSNILWSQSFVSSGEENVSGIDLLASEMELSELVELGDTKAAEELVDNVLEKIPASEIKSNVNLIDFVVLCGLVKMIRGELDDAEQLLNQVVILSRNEFGAESIELATALQSLSRLYVEQNRLEDAAKEVQKANRILEMADGGDAIDRALAKNNLAQLYFLDGEHQKAIVLLKKTLADLQEQELGPNLNGLKKSFEAMIQSNIGTNFFFLRDLEQSTKNLEETIEASEELPPSFKDRLLTQACINISVVECAKGKVDEATEYMDRGLRFLTPGLKGQMQSLSPLQQLEKLYREPYIAYHGALSICSQYPADNASIRLGANAVTNLKGIASEALGICSKNKAVDPSEESGLDWVTAEQIFQKLPVDTLLIDIASYRPFDFSSKSFPEMWKPARYGAWVYRRSDQNSCTFYDLGDAARLNQLVFQYRSSIQDGLNVLGTTNEGEEEKKSNRLGRTLASFVLDPILKDNQNGGIKKLIISPDSNLWLVPWAALPLNDGHYLVEEFTINMVLHARSLCTESPNIDLEQPIVFADPNFDLKLNSGKELQKTAEQSRENVNRLEGTFREAIMIAPQIHLLTSVKPKLFIREEAVESNTKIIKRPRIAHFATHAFCKPAQPLNAALLLNPVQDPIDNPALKKFRGPLRSENGQQLGNPWENCGLYLSGCNQGSSQSYNNGLMTGQEILELDFYGTELVVLSGCKTSVGSVQLGEGVVGLNQAFLIAGAQAVLGSLWRIDDSQTIEEMAGFYRNCKNGISYQEALATTQRERIAFLRNREEVKAAHPLAWASFQLTTAN